MHRRSRTSQVVAAMAAAMLVFGAAGPAVAAEPADTPDASISGMVTRPAGVELSDGDVDVSVYTEVYSASTPHTTVSVAADGSYTITDLEPGTYYLEFTATSLGLATQWWSGAVSRYNASPIELSTGQQRTGVDVALFVGATISGTVSRPAGVTAGLVEVVLKSSSTSEGAILRTQAAKDGTYALSGVPAGRYKLFFDAQAMNAASEYWKNTSTWSEARVFTVVDGQTKRISAALAKTAKISGKVTLPRGSRTSLTSISVLAYSATGDRAVVGGAPVRKDGTYVITRLPAGSYKVLFAGAGNVASEWWSNKTDWAKAQRITLTKGTSKTANATLAVGKSTISGKIMGSRATVRQGAYVTAYRLASDGVWEAVAAASTNHSTGAYKLIGLTAGKHTVKFERITVEETCEWEHEECATPPGTVLTKWWKNKPDAESATRISLTANRAVSGISTDLDTPPATQTLTKKTPKISGTPTVGRTLTAIRGTWTKGTTFAYRWYADGSAIGGATKKSFTLTESERGKKIAVTVTGKKDYYTTARKTSKPTSPVR